MMSPFHLELYKHMWSTPVPHRKFLSTPLKPIDRLYNILEFLISKSNFSINLSVTTYSNRVFVHIPLVTRRLIFKMSTSSYVLCFRLCKRNILIAYISDTIDVHTWYFKYSSRVY